MLSKKPFYQLLLLFFSFFISKEYVIVSYINDAAYVSLWQTTFHGLSGGFLILFTGLTGIPSFLTNYTTPLSLKSLSEISIGIASDCNSIANNKFFGEGSRRFFRYHFQKQPFLFKNLSNES